jgi:hypothetical protein
MQSFTRCESGRVRDGRVFGVICARGSAITTLPVVPAQAGIIGLRSWVPVTGSPRHRRRGVPLAGDDSR